VTYNTQDGMVVTEPMELDDDDELSKLCETQDCLLINYPHACCSV